MKSCISSQIFLKTDEITFFMQDFEDEVTRGKEEIDQLKVSLEIEREKSLSEKSRRRKVKHIKILTISK